MKNLVLIVDRLEGLKYSAIVDICKILEVDVLPIFEAESLLDFNLLLNLYGPTAILLFNTGIVAELYPTTRIGDMDNQIRSSNIMGLERIMLLTSAGEISEYALKTFKEML